ncbi:MAG TPA: sialidase family protein, partial [Bryobacteraceae bacterium]|nr:sialidase family protein [Bryobacteraceae bacterium]
FRKGYPWRVLAVGPGHGLQLKSGRLLAPVWLSTGTGGHAHRPSVAATIYSDDRGRTWRAGAIAIGDTPEWVNPGETTAVELSGGRVMLNVRSESKQNRRLVTVSKDGISGWSSPRFQEELPEPICFGSIARVSGNILVFSNPDNLTKTNGEAEPGKPRDRRNLTIHLSEDEGKSWKRKRVLDQGWAGYSDLVVRPNGELLCLYERGRSEALTLARFNLDWVRKPAS